MTLQIYAYDETHERFFSDCTQAIHPAPTQMPIFISKVMESWLRLDFLIPGHHALEGTEN